MKVVWFNILLLFLTLYSRPVLAHFQVLLPSSDIITPDDNRTIELKLLFTHPMAQGPLMNMEMPKQFGVMANGSKQDLLPTLEPHRVQGKTFFTARYLLKSPADYIFFLEPAPYWEATEGKMIIHYTKVVVDAFTADTGWDQPVGFPVEIEPLVRPYGLWTGNLFRALVKKEGIPVPFAMVEVEHFNEGEQVKIPSDPFLTQQIKTDAQGVFAYTMPKSGWWGFAALIDGDTPLINSKGDPSVPVELGALMWVKTVDMR